MHQRFERQVGIDATDPLVIIQAADRQGEVPALQRYLDDFQQQRPEIIPVKTADRLVMIRTADIVLADVQETALLIYTAAGMTKTRETLRHLLQRLASDDFIQVSKHGVLNLNHLLSLEDSFSGNMTACLTNQLKTSVSRKYVKDLMKRLGI
ncbi:LytTR family DNA-binding domain-containing protein [Levilactobacillus tujiorum]|uniref:LytTR family transcriptional regulator n=1 Tax=Levilactobacillus tujiorum TaxID=2912243 RepID=A0ABX1L320_9LACO|nr:LytTR family transcriptional regulator [Levilactobacillus tujiorum]NLR10876.1 LytTR family transcriptional regulator [Lactobacillus sp. HBUAS51387]NLR28658.1 LytTR family transcriptional regulator [Levilactobacillus tujiorum]